MHRLTVRLLGGFDVRWDGEPVLGFESQKVRALFAYLAVRRGAALSRDQLAALLWADRGEESARRNLRQALYNIRVTFPDTGEEDVVVADHQSVRLNPRLDCWLDVRAFEEALAVGVSEDGSDPQQLAVASRLYGGDLLAGFLVRDSPGFEEWLIAEQGRLREGAIEAIRRLVEAYLARGEHRVGIQYALRLVTIDPLSEEAHGYLMRLYALSGRRARALAQFEELRKLLNSELGVEPMDETVVLYRSILHEELPGRPEAEDRPLAPVIPLVGRQEAYATLDRSWGLVRRGEGRLTVVAGEPGMGKSRLAASFVDSVTSRRQARVLRGCCHENAPLVSFGPFSEALGDLLASDPTLVERTVGDASQAVRRALTGLLLGSPETVGITAGAISQEVPPRGELFGALRRMLIALTSLPRMRGRGPVILLLDDLQWADPSSLELLNHLVAEPLEAPVWILATCRAAERAPARLTELLERAAADRADRVDRVTIGPLDEESVTEVAAALVAGEDVEELSQFLTGLAAGRPLAVAELINHLWDEDVLEPAGPTSWRLSRRLEGELREPFASIDALILRRVRHLPTSVRRLLYLAAVCGPRFDARLLCLAGDEHSAIVETALELLLERWLIRKSLAAWAQPARQSDLELWASGGRAGQFELAHPAIRAALLRHLDSGRARAMHRQVAAALESIHGDDRERACEALLYHLEAAGERRSLLPDLVTAAERAWAVRGDENAATFRRRAAALLREGTAEAGKEAGREALQGYAERLEVIAELVG